MLLMRMRTILMMSLPLLRLLMLMIFGMIMAMLRPIAAAARHFPWQFYLLVLLFCGRLLFFCVSGFVFLLYKIQYTARTNERKLRF